MNALFEFLPLILFLTAYLIFQDIYIALGVLMVAMPIAVLVKRVRTGAYDKMMTWSAITLYVFGALTFYFRDPKFLYWKPTAFYWAVAVAFLVSQFVGGKPLVQRAFALIEGFNLERVETGQWRKLNLVWIAFFIAAGLLNIYVAYNFDEATWVNFKVFGLMGLTFLFMIGQTFWLARFMDEEETEVQEESE